MKLTVLADNNTFIDQYYLGEPAVSYYIEIDDCRILFDTGYSDAFLRNAQRLGIDLGAITHLVLSHGHNDHTGGLHAFLDSFDLSHVTLIAHPGCFEPKKDGDLAIGSPLTENEIRSRFLYQPARTPMEPLHTVSFSAKSQRFFRLSRDMQSGRRSGSDNGQPISCLTILPSYAKQKMGCLSSPAALTAASATSPNTRCS